MEGQGIPSMEQALEAYQGVAYHLHQINLGVVNPLEQVLFVYLFLEEAFHLLQFSLEQPQGRGQNSNQSFIKE
jgi:hypothetical protein